MKLHKLQYTLLKVLLVLFLINYQVVTIGLHDFVIFKYLRDIVLLCFIVLNLIDGKIKIKFSLILFFLLTVLISIQVLCTDSTSVFALFARRYIEPLLLLVMAADFKFVSKECYYDMIRFMLNFLFILSLWGIFQAFVLGPNFLIRLGYPVVDSYVYGKKTLRSSFFFGNLGIQRVVSTVSNSNVFAVILGISIIFILMNYKETLKGWVDYIKYGVIILAYLLTFSRANFLAMGLVVFFLAWKYIPKKEYIIGSILVAMFLFVIIYVFQNESGITHKILNWVINSITMNESSAAGRTGIWKTAFEEVVKKPFGLGFGHVGSWAQTAGVKEFFHCENSYLAMALDLGWLGPFIYVLLLLCQIIQGYVIKRTNYLIGMSIMMIISYIMICMFFSNHIYDMEAMVCCYIIITLNYGYENMLIKEKSSK